MKKRIFTAILFCGVFFVVHAQEKIDSRIIEVFGDQTSEFFVNDPEKFKLFNDLVQNRIEIVVCPQNEKQNCPKLSEMELLNKYNPGLVRDVVFDPTHFNALKYNLDFFPKTSPTFYRVDNTNYLIVIKPQSSN